MNPITRSFTTRRVFLGFIESGRRSFLLSYSYKDNSLDDDDDLTEIVSKHSYELSFWFYYPGKALRLVSSGQLSGLFLYGTRFWQPIWKFCITMRTLERFHYEPSTAFLNKDLLNHYSQES